MYHNDLMDHIEVQEQINNNYDSNWECHQCHNDVIRLVVFDRIDGTFYFRRCSSCGNKTKVKKYNDKVEGIK